MTNPDTVATPLLPRATCAVALLSLLLSAPRLHAESLLPADRKPPEFIELDTDGDGRLSLEEFAADKSQAQAPRAEARFRRLDVNADGELTPQEFSGGSLWQWWLGTFSVAMFIASLVTVPMVVVRLPADYFTHAHKTAEWVHSPTVRIEWIIFKNLAGFILILGGLAMLVLPGQGVLAMLLGIALLDFPGKQRVVAWIVARPGVLSSINWIRQRRGVPPMKTPVSSRPPRVAPP